MRGGFGGRGFFDDFFSDFFPARRRRRTRGRTPPRRAERIDVTQFFSDATRELLQRAAQTALEWGSLDLDSDHLLYAALQDDVVRHVLGRSMPTGGDRGAGRGRGRTGRANGRVALVLSRMRRPLCSPRTRSRARWAPPTSAPSTYCSRSPRDDESQAGRLLQRFGVSHTKLRGAVIRGVESGRRHASRPHADSRRVRARPHAQAREGKLDPVIGRADEVEETIEILSRRTKNNPALIGEPGVGKTAIVEGIAQRIVNDDVPGDARRQALVVARPRRPDRRLEVPRRVRGAPEEGDRRGPRGRAGRSSSSTSYTQWSAPAPRKVRWTPGTC